MECSRTETGGFYFAVRRETGRAVNISEMEEKDRGAACGCICAACGRPLVAKLGRGKRSAHFAHKVENGVKIDCSAEKANESGLHKLAKQIVQEGKSIVLPKITIAGTKDPNCNEDDIKQRTILVYKDERRFFYNEVQLEASMGDFIPDICVSNGKNILLIEIAVTHFVDEEKHQKIRKAGRPTIEINIAEFLNNAEFSYEKLKKRLLDLPENKKWIFHSLEAKALEAVCERNQKWESERKRKENRRQEYIEQQKEHQNLTKNKCERLRADKEYYLRVSRELIRPQKALKNINDWHICGLTLNQIEELPVFLNIPVFGEVAFNCDRRIWQSIIFERYFFGAKAEKLFSPVKGYYYLVGQHKDYLNKEFVHIRKKEGRILFPRDEQDVLRCAIEEYLVHLSALEFMNIEYYYNPNATADYSIINNTLEPPNKRYANFLKNTIPRMPPTNDPFGYLQERWIRLMEEDENPIIE